MDLEIFRKQERLGVVEINKYINEQLFGKILNNKKYYQDIKNLIISSIDEQNKIAEKINYFMDKIFDILPMSFDNLEINKNQTKLYKYAKYLIEKKIKIQYAHFKHKINLFEIKLESEDKIIISLNKIFLSIIRSYSTDFWYITSYIIEDLKKIKKDELTIFNFYQTDLNNIIIPSFFIKDENLDNKIIKEIFLQKHIIKIVMEKYFGQIEKKHIDNFNIFLLLVDVPKKFYTKNNQIVFSPKYTNSAKASLDEDFIPKKINLFRKEEISKIIFHEMLHTVDFDKLLNDFPKEEMVNWSNKWAIKRLDMDENRLMLNETITEVLAEFINIVVTNYLDKRKFEVYWKYELFLDYFELPKSYIYQDLKQINNLIKS